MVRYVIRRLLMMIPVLLGVMLIVFFFQSVSGDDPVKMLLGQGALEEDVIAMRAKLGLDQPIFVQYFRYVWNFITKGDLGTSYTTGRPVFEEIMIRFPYTLRLALISVAIGSIIGIPLGIISAVKQNTWFDNAVRGFTVFMSSFPGFWLALLLIILFAVKLNWLPSNGVIEPAGWVLPIVCVSIGTITGLTRTTRASVLETIHQDFVRTARAKGQREPRVITKHVIRNSLIPVINNIGIVVGAQLGGSLIIESIFGVPGVGQYAVAAINNRNYPAVLGSVVILAFLFSLITLLVDIIYVVIDPRLVLTFTRTIIAKRQKRELKRRQRQAGAEV
ncbi:MAG TPA: ABC transporter permease [Papillibacter sp.]|nr:ABC transporter permease [Papillibacter sp.]